MTRKQTAVYLLAILAILVVLMSRAHAQTLPVQASMLVRYTGMSWAGGGAPIRFPWVSVQRTSPECRLTATEQKTWTCASLWAVDAISGAGVDGVIVHLTGDGITSDVFKTISGGLVQMRVKQAKRYTITVDQPTGYREIHRGMTKYGQSYLAGSDALGPKTSDLLVLQLWPK